MLNTRKKPSRLKRYASHDGMKMKKDTTCGRVITENGEILSPNYPNDYNISASEMLMYRNCKWVIRGNSEQKIVLEFLELQLGDELSDNEDCRYDSS